MTEESAARDAEDDLADGEADNGADTPLPETAPGADPFDAIRQKATASGGFFWDLPHHVMAYVPVPGAERLVVTFDNLAAPREAVRTIWGHKVIPAQGWSMLGVLIKRKDWFRDPGLWNAFDLLRDGGFFRRYPQVSMTGASMGGYAALAYAPAAPGCTVLAFAPQTSLDPAVVPFEARYRFGRLISDWTVDRYRDAAEGVQAAGKAYVIYDPRVPEDALHAARITAPQVTKLQVRHIGHKVPPALLRMGVLKPVVIGGLQGTLTEAEFFGYMRERRKFGGFTASLLERARNRGQPRSELAVVRAVQALTPHWKLRHRANALRAEIAALEAAKNPPAPLDGTAEGA